MQPPSAVVLAAGEGSRLRPLTEHRPKPMLPAATKPILEHVLDELCAAGVEELTLVVGHGRRRVQSHFGPSYRDRPIEYVHQRKQLGSGHALLAAEDAVDTPCLVVNGDQIVDRRILEEVVAGHDGAAATLGVVGHADPSVYGGALLDDGRVTALVERPRDDGEYLLNAGVYVLEDDAFEAIRRADPRAGEHSLTDGLAELIDAGGRVDGVVSEGLWVDATYPWDLLYVADEVLADGRNVRGGVDPDARIHASATIREPAVISADCVVGPGAVVGPGSCLGENVTVGANAVVEGSVVDADTRVGANATLVDCVTGRGVRVGNGSTVVGGPGDVRVGDRIHRGERLGALLADRVRDGGGVTYAPGTIVGTSAVVHAGSTVRGTVEDETVVSG